MSEQPRCNSNTTEKTRFEFIQQSRVWYAIRIYKSFEVTSAEVRSKEIFIHTVIFVLLVGFMGIDDFKAALLVIQWIEDLVEAGVPLLLIHKVDELCHADEILLGAGEGKGVDFSIGERIICQKPTGPDSSQDCRWDADNAKRGGVIERRNSYPTGKRWQSVPEEVKKNCPHPAGNTSMEEL